MSIQIVTWFGLAWSVARLFRLAARGRFYRRLGTAAPNDFVRNVVGTTAVACIFGALLVGIARPLALTGFLITMGLLAFEVIRGVRTHP
jgi:hypothetical protein